MEEKDYYDVFLSAKTIIQEYPNCESMIWQTAVVLDAWRMAKERFDGECFYYSVYLEDELTDEKFEEIDKTIGEFIESYNAQEIYLGYLDVTNAGDKVSIYLDLGNVNPDNENAAIQGILKALNKVTGIKSVIVNEEYDFDF